MQSIENFHVVVIGAGLSGLSAARALTQLGVSVVILDAGKRVADPWRKRHPQLRLNIHRFFAGLTGLTAPRRDGPFIKRDTVIDYLERYADSVDAPICFDAAVTGLEQTGQGWRVTTADRVFHCGHVVVATGRDRLPQVPNWPGVSEYAGEMRHAADFGEVSRYDGKRILVIGAGNSGADVLNHLSNHAPSEVRIAVRNGPAVVPTRVFGFPLHRLAKVFAALPAFLLDPAFRLTQRLFLGDLGRYNLKSHPDGGGTRLLRDGIAFAMDDGFVKAIKDGRFRVVDNVAGFTHDHVVFEDGSTFTPDVVICATGYRNGLETLLSGLDVLDDRGQPRHPMGEADKAHPGLWFTGFKPIFTGYFDAANIAAERIAKGVCTRENCRLIRVNNPLAMKTNIHTRVSPELEDAA